MDRLEIGPNDAVPSAPTGTGDPDGVPSTSHCTEPVDTGLPPVVTVAVKLTGWPKTGLVTVGAMVGGGQLRD